MQWMKEEEQVTMKKFVIVVRPGMPGEMRFSSDLRVSMSGC